MKAATIVGIVLIIIGVVVLALQGITLTTGEEVAQVGPIEVTRETDRTIPLPPVLGALALAGGVVLVLVGARALLNWPTRDRYTCCAVCSHLWGAAAGQTCQGGVVWFR